MNILKYGRDTRTQSMFVLSPLMFCLVGTASIGASAAEAEDPGVLKTTVRYARYNLATDSGAQALYRRLTAAAEQVCPQPSGGGPFVTIEVKRCREKAVRQAVLDIDDARLAGVLSAMIPGERGRGRAVEHASGPIKPENFGG